MTDLMWTHYSGDTFMSLAKLQEDAERLTATQDRHWITMTEMAQPESLAAVKDVVGRHYQVVNPDGGDIAFLVSKHLPVLRPKGTLVVPRKAGAAAKGGHGPRYVSEFSTEYDGEEVTVLGIHLVTLKVAGKVSPTRRRQQIDHLTAMGQRMSQVGKGRRIAVCSGDCNGDVDHRADMASVFDRYHLTTTAQETGVHTPTHADAHLDWVWTRDADQRAVVNAMTVHRGPAWNSDHDPIDVWATVQ